MVLMGPGIGEVTPVGSNQVYSNSSLDEVRVVLINQNDGTLAFRVEVADTTIEPAAIVEEVVDPGNRLRPTADGYELEFRR